MYMLGVNKTFRKKDKVGSLEDSAGSNGSSRTN